MISISDKAMQCIENGKQVEVRGLSVLQRDEVGATMQMEAELWLYVLDALAYTMKNEKGHLADVCEALERVLVYQLGIERKEKKE